MAKSWVAQSRMAQKSRIAIAGRHMPMVATAATLRMGMYHGPYMGMVGLRISSCVPMSMQVQWAFEPLPAHGPH